MVLVGGSEDFSAAGRPELVQRRAAQRSVVHDALRVLPVNDFPGFSDWHRGRQDFSKEVFKAASTPDALHGEGLKDDRFGGHLVYFNEGAVVCNSFCKAFAVLAGSAKLVRIEIFMANKPKGYGTWDAALGLTLLGLAVLLFLALVSYQPSDLPSWAKLIYDSNVRSPIVHNLCGVVGAVVAGYLYFFFGAASYLWIIVFAGYGIAKLTTRNFLIRERLGWSFLFVLSGACLLQLQPWFLKGWNRAFRIEGPGGWIGKWVGERAFGGPLGEVGAPIVLGIVYLASLILAIGFHPISVLKSGWGGDQKAYRRTRKAAHGRDGGDRADGFRAAQAVPASGKARAKA